LTLDSFKAYVPFAKTNKEEKKEEFTVSAKRNFYGNGYIIKIYYECGMNGIHEKKNRFSPRNSHIRQNQHADRFS